MTFSINQLAIKQQAMKNLVGLTVIASLAIGSAYADITLQVDDNIKVTAINGQEISQSPFQPLKKTFELTPGKHVITAKYDRLFDLRRDEHDYLRSGNVTVTADMLNDNQTYRLTMPGQPNDYKSAKDYAKSPTLAVEQGGQIIAQQQGTSGNDGSLFAGLTGAVGGLFGGDDAQRENQQVIASIDQNRTEQNRAISSRPVTTNTNVIPAVQTSVPAQANNASTLDQFMQLWLNATPAEREKIRQWVQE